MKLVDLGAKCAVFMVIVYVMCNFTINQYSYNYALSTHDQFLKVQGHWSETIKESSQPLW